MGINWASIPLARITVGFATGILLGHFLPLELPRPVLFILPFLLITGFRVGKNPRIRYTIVFSCWMVAGMWAIQWQSSLHDENYFSDLNEKKEIESIGSVVEISPGDDHTRVLLDLSHRVADGETTPATGQWMLWLEGDSSVESQRALINSQLQVRAVPELPRPAMNPGAFDYRFYLWSRDIHRTAYVPRDQWKIISSSGTPGIVAFSRKIKYRLLKRLKQYIPNEESAAFAGALLLGHKDDLSKEIQTNFQRAGASHIMAVSGLHVGIIYSMIFLLLGGLSRLWHIPKIIQTGVLILGVWSFAFICGLPASVCRAALMFSIWRCSKHTFAESRSFNAFFGAGLLLLLIEPKYLFQVGFQFSFLAVAGILLLFPVLKKLYRPKNALVHYAWQIILVSACAQLFLLPLTGYYFGYCTLLSLISSLIVIPVAYLILGLGVFLLGVAMAWPPLAIVSGYLLDYIILGTLYSIDFIQTIPFGQWNVEQMAAFTPILMILMLMALTGIVLTKKRFYLKMAIVTVALAGGINLFNHVQGRGGTLKVLHADALSVHWQQNGTSIPIHSSIERNAESSSCRFLVHTEDISYRMLILRGNKIPHSPKNELWLIDEGWPPNYTPENLPHKILLPKYLPYKQRGAWISFADSTSVSIHNIRDQGAFIDQNILKL